VKQQFNGLPEHLNIGEVLDVIFVHGAMVDSLSVGSKLNKVTTVLKTPN
jgi:hypothetical protein